MAKFSRFFNECIVTFKKHKILVSSVSIFLVFCILISVVIVSSLNDNNTKNLNSNKENISSNDLQTSNSDNIESEESEVESLTVSVDSSEESSDISSVSSANNSSTYSETKSSKPQSTSSKVTSSNKPTTTNSDFKYNGNTDINDNVFLDSLVYTGYNLKKHIADGNMWVYILASQKRGLGYLSNITYAGGSTGYETTKDGKPDIKAFERKGLVCASFVTYVYFNYLPNVAGIDTSFLTKPVKSYSANDWYIAAKDWVKKGHSKTISFKASKTSSGYINFNPSENIPIGSLMFCCDAKNRSDYCSHVSIYAGYKNGYHWVYHVGNENGPEFCAMERMHFGPDPQWPINIITTPKNLRFDAALEITVKDDSNKPLSGVKFSLKNLETSKTIDLGKTNTNGVIVKENIPYGKYQLTQTEISGYKNEKLTQDIELTTKNNSYNKITVINTKIIPPTPSNTESQNSNSSNTSSKENISSNKVTSSENVKSEISSTSSTITSSKENISSENVQSENSNSSSTVTSSKENISSENVPTENSSISSTVTSNENVNSENSNTSSETTQNTSSKSIISSIEQNLSEN